MVVRRAVKISLKWVGVRDRRRLGALIEAYRAAVNFYIRLQAIPRAERGLRLPGVQLVIEADVCICCGACAAVCPASAIYPDDDLPLGEQGAIELARVFFAARSGP